MYISLLDVNPTIEEMNRLTNITEMNFYLDKLDNTDILTDDKLRNLFLKYFVNDYRDLPKQPQYKKLKNGILDSLTFKIFDQNNNMIKNTLGRNVLFHIMIVYTVSWKKIATIN